MGAPDMKRAQAADAFRRVLEKREHWHRRLTKISYGNVPTLGTGSIPLPSPISVICGYCGSGKSTILRLVWAALSPTEALVDNNYKKKLSAGTGTISTTLGNTQTNVTVSFGPIIGSGLADTEIVYVDSARILSESMRYFSGDIDVDAMLEGTAERKVESSGLREVKSIIARDYSSLTLYELELANDLTVPFFVVTYRNSKYDNRTMGAGELCALYVWWIFQRAKALSIVLIEEPESFISAASQVSLMEHIMEAAYEKKISVILTSHSPSVILSLPQDAARFLVRGTNGVAFEEFPHPMLRQRIGIYPEVEVVVFVEDVVARFFAQALIRAFDPSLGSTFDLRHEGSAAEIVSRLMALPRDLRTVRFVGFLDGDARAEVPKVALDIVAFLPGAAAPEEELRSVANGEAAALGSSLGIPAEQVLGALEGKDVHDWLSDLAHFSSMSRERVVEALVEIWLTRKGNKKLAKDSIAELKTCIARALE